MISALPVTRDDVSGHVCDRLAGAQYRLGERMLSPQRPGELIVGDVGRVVLIHVDLFEHHGRFGFDLGLTKCRALNHFGQQIHSHRQIFIPQLSPVAGVFLRGERVAPGSHRVEGLGDLPGADLFGSLEEQVLQKVRTTRLDVRLVAATGVDPASDGDRTNRRHRLGDDAKAVWKRGELMIHQRRMLQASPHQPVHMIRSLLKWG